MNKTILTIDQKAKRAPERFRGKAFRRLIGLCLHYKTTLVIGLMCTVAFACLHTVSIGAAFPIFKILLEEEGLLGWSNRILAGERLDADISLTTDSGDVLIVKLHSHSALYQQGLRAGDRIWDPEHRPVTEWFAEMSHLDDGADIQLQTDATQAESSISSSSITVTAIPLDRAYRMLRWGSTFIPGDSHQDKLFILKSLLFGLIGIVIVANIFRYFGEVLIAHSILRAMMHLRTNLYAHTLQLPMSFFAGRPTSDLVGRFVQDIQEVQRGMLTFFSKFIREPLRALFILSGAFILDWQLTLMVLTIGPILVLIFWQVGRRVKKSNRKLLEAYGQMIGALTASLQNLRVVKAYTAEQHEQNLLLRVDKRVFKQQFKLAKMQALVSPLIETIAVFAGSLVALWLAMRVLNAELSISKFMLLGVALSLLFDPFRKLSDVYVRVQRATAGADRIFQIIDQPIEQVGGVDQIELTPLKDCIEFIDVTFTYPGAEVPAIQDVNLTIRRGETVAIVGPNGSGKTTLMSLLPRLFDPQSGTILYDGVNIKESSLRSLRHQIGLVSQEAIVFAATPLENIAYGAPQSNDQKAIDAAQRAYADEFIKNIPGGYNSDLGERGSTLSGGQRQRLAIARAIFRNAPILIFDEATSQIDTESELKIQNALQEFAKDRTTFIIAHRLSTIQFADRIVVMEAGRVIDVGNHQELFNRCDVYRNLCETQFVTESV